MDSVIALSVITLFLMALVAVYVKEGKPFKAFLSGVLGLVFFIILVSGVAPYQLGAGRVPNKAESPAQRLDGGVVYQLVLSARDGADHILLLVEKRGVGGTNAVGGTVMPNFYAIRVKEVPPEYFTLIDGKPVAVIPSVATTDAK